MSPYKKQDKWFGCCARIGPLPCQYIKTMSQGKGIQQDKVKQYAESINWKLSKEQQLLLLEEQKEQLRLSSMSRLVLRKMIGRGYKNLEKLQQLPAEQARAIQEAL